MRWTSLLLLAACNHAAETGVDAGSAAPIDAPIDADDLALRQSAAQTTATSAAACTPIGDFYWQIGNATQKLGEGAVGTTYTATKNIAIASASKIVFGAFMVESTHGALTDMQKSELRMLSGYNGLNPVLCSPTPTIAGCLNAGTPGPNYTYSPDEVGRFHYDGAHDQFYINTPTTSGGEGIGAMTAEQLTTLVFDTLQIQPGFKYASPLPSGGINASPDQFAVFLRAVVAGNLMLHDYLGAEAVCTLPGASCPTAVSSPAAPYPWHYSFNHWVEDDPATSDGAFSSPGAFGFYPWISADKTLYGILSRESTTGRGGIDSAACGIQIRKAWTTGVAQP